jgi:hypothetical protein
MGREYTNICYSNEAVAGVSDTVRGGGLTLTLSRSTTCLPTTPSSVGIRDNKRGPSRASSDAHLPRWDKNCMSCLIENKNVTASVFLSHVTLTLLWPVGHICPTYRESFQVCWDNSIPLFFPCCHLPWSISIPLNQSECIFPQNSHLQMILCAMLHAPLHTVFAKHVEQFPDKTDCVTLHLVRYILEYYYNAWTYER